MPLVRKIFPSSTDASGFGGRSNLIFLSEGYLASEERQFYEDANRTIESLFQVYPFNMVKSSKKYFNFYVHFEASSNSGPAIDVSATTNRTLFESSLNSSSELLSLNNNLIDAVVDSLTIYESSDDTEINVSDIMSKEDNSFSSIILVVLIPETAGVASNGGEYLNEASSINYPYVAFTNNGRVGQLLANFIGSKLGLAPEYDLDGITYESFESDPSVMEHFTKHNIALPSQTNIEYGTMWYSILRKDQLASPPLVVNNPNPTVANRILPAYPYSTDVIEFYEGANGFRTNMFRAAEDCIMRRRIGDTQLPLRKDLICFCPLCRHYLSNIFRL